MALYAAIIWQVLRLWPSGVRVAAPLSPALQSLARVVLPAASPALLSALLIGLARGLWDREARTLSGGEKARTQMARELVSVPDLLLLDEPTNHLDLAGIEWLESWLKEIHSAVVMVSHDRRMLDQVVDAIVEIERGQLIRFPGNYSRYVELKRERFESANRAWEIQQDEIRREETFIKKRLIPEADAGNIKAASAPARPRVAASACRASSAWSGPTTTSASRSSGSRRSAAAARRSWRPTT